MADEKHRDAPLPDDPHGLSPAEEQIRRDEGRTERPRVRYEPRDVRNRWILTVIVAAVFLGGCQLFFVWLFFQARRDQLDRSFEASRHPLAPPPGLKLPAEPRLEQLDRMAGNEAPNVARRERANERLLASYGPTADKDFIHVPIDRAIEQVASQLPVRKQTPEIAAERKHNNGLLDAGASNSGRLFRGTSP